MENPIQRAHRWDRKFLRLARYWACENSKDPSTKVGAVIVNQLNRVVGLGYNGFPGGVADLPERLNDRPTKYQFVVHAEANAILNATADVRGCTVYVWPLFTCNECAKLVIQAGIKRVVCPERSDEDTWRWGPSFESAQTMYREAGVQFDFIDWREPKRHIQTDVEPERRGHYDECAQCQDPNCGIYGCLRQPKQD